MNCCDDRLSSSNPPHRYLRALSAAQRCGSTGRVGTYADNAAMELFSILPQKNVRNRLR